MTHFAFFRLKEVKMVEKGSKKARGRGVRTYTGND